MALTTRQRRSPTDLHTTSTPQPYSKLDKPEKSTGDGERGLGWLLPLLSLGMLRYMSASSNIIHDCDEVFNYWEPFHFLLYKSGFQTWEYRFLYPIYPLICVAASAVLESFPDLFRDKYNPNDSSLLVVIAKALRPLALGLILCASHSRTFSLINGYSAPLEIYKHLEHHDDVGEGSVLCVGSEWHRYPSSFLVPDYVKEVRWIDDGFRGLLPFPFNSSSGGTSAAPSYFNNKNKASDQQYFQDLYKCTFLVELHSKDRIFLEGVT